MERKVIDIIELRSRIIKHTLFHLTADYVLSPLKVTATYDRVCVSITGSPYVILKDGDNFAYIRHIKKIESEDREQGTTYFLTCLQHIDFNTAIDITYEIKCC